MPRKPDNEKAKVKVNCRINPKLKNWGIKNGVNFSRLLEEKLKEEKAMVESKQINFCLMPETSISQNDVTKSEHWELISDCLMKNMIVMITCIQEDKQIKVVFHSAYLDKYIADNAAMRSVMGSDDSCWTELIALHQKNLL